MPSSHHHARPDRTVLSVSCLSRRCEFDSRRLKTVADRKCEVGTRSEQSSSSHRTRHRQHCLVVPGGRCELGIRLHGEFGGRLQLNSCATAAAAAAADEDDQMMSVYSLIGSPAPVHKVHRCELWERIDANATAFVNIGCRLSVQLIGLARAQ